ncbi:MAG TPA: outer membrane protein [Pseudolabrys sp.]|nr:outer membrane protein [Pseudolabrys sp.]
MRTLTAIGAALAVLGFATAASAADMPARNYTKAPAYAPALYNWTGFYVGVNAGGAWSSTNSNFGDASGFVGGGQIGYNWQAVGSPLVLGLEADFQGTSLKNSATVTTILGPTTGESKVPAFGTVRGRIGYAFDRALIYATGGWAYSNTKASVSAPGFSASDSKWASGWTLGGGAEWAFAGPWSVKAEYLYVNAKSVDLNIGGVGVSTGDYHYNVVRAGLNYRF